MKLHFVVAVSFLQLFNPRLNLFHFGHALIGFVGYREHQKTEQGGKQENGPAHVSDEVVKEIENIEKRFGQEVVPAEVDGEIKLGNVKLFGIVVQQFDFFGAGKHLDRIGTDGARSDGYRCADIICLIGVFAGIAEFDGAALSVVHDKGRKPVAVGKACPAAGCFEVFFFAVFKIFVFDLF